MRIMCCSQNEEKNHYTTKEHIIGNQNIGRRLFIDISSVKFRESGKTTNKPYWLVIVEEQMQAKFSRFLHKKKELPDTMCTLVDKWNKGGLNIKYISWIMLAKTRHLKSSQIVRTGA